MGEVVILGYGAVGRALAARLTAAGRAVTVAQRSMPAALPDGAAFTAVDMYDAAAVRAVCSGSKTVACTLGLPYQPGLWAKAWPVFMGHLIDAVAACGARLVFADNLYMYGPQNEPLREDMALTDFGEKPRVRAQITRLWMEAHAAGRIQAAAVRASDFYGPGAATSMLVEYGVKPVLEGRAASFPIDVDHPHAFTYVPDFARALETLMDAPDAAYGQAWHVPNAPAQSLRSIVQRAGALAGEPARVKVMPGWMKALARPFVPALRALDEMEFQTDRPYRVDHSKFAARFWDDATPFDVGLQATIDALRRA